MCYSDITQKVWFTFQEIGLRFKLHFIIYLRLFENFNPYIIKKNELQFGLLVMQN
jgi:hypothetical protein